MESVRGSPKIERRMFLLGAAGGMTGLVGASLSDAALGSSAQASPLHPDARVPDWKALEAALGGPLLRRGDAGYSRAAQTFDPRRDRLAPAAIVQVKSTDDVGETLKFGQRYDLALRPRSGGHSYVGASTGNGVLVIDTGKLKGIHYDKRTRRVRVNAGVTLGDLHRELERHQRTVPTGTCPTVGVAGQTLGGGVGAETRLHGLTLDAVIAIRVVTPDGKMRLVSARKNADLFWALRGGGGGNFGVVTQFIMKTFPTRSAELFFLRWSTADSVAVVRGWQRRLASMPRTSWAQIHLEARGGGVVPRMVGVAWDGNGRREAEKLINEIGPRPASISYASRSHPGVMESLAGPGGTTRQSWLAGSDILSEPLRKKTVEALVQTIHDRGRAGEPGVAILDPLGGAVRDGSRRTSSFPWRRSLATLQWYVGLSSSADSSEVSSAASFIRRGHHAFGGASAGAYINYVEEGRQLRDYYGDSWQRLTGVSRKYDPEGVLSSPFSVPS